MDVAAENTTVTVCVDSEKKWTTIFKMEIEKQNQSKSKMCKIDEI